MILSRFNRPGFLNPTLIPHSWSILESSPISSMFWGNFWLRLVILITCQSCMSSSVKSISRNIQVLGSNGNFEGSFSYISLDICSILFVSQYTKFIALPHLKHPNSSTLTNSQVLNEHSINHNPSNGRALFMYRSRRCHEECRSQEARRPFSYSLEDAHCKTIRNCN